jgi:hypothetical protein
MNETFRVVSVRDARGTNMVAWRAFLCRPPTTKLFLWVFPPPCFSLPFPPRPPPHTPPSRIGFFIFEHCKGGGGGEAKGVSGRGGTKYCLYWVPPKLSCSLTEACSVISFGALRSREEAPPFVQPTLVLGRQSFLQSGMFCRLMLGKCMLTELPE